ncbi:MAG: nicotinate (nicotinamide) nucleotide adenylyltransferase [Oscillospiraceae bacterium]
MKIGIYGGTFDPPHLGHMEAARASVAALELDKLIFMPAKQPPHKPLSAVSAAPEQRVAMTKLMADGLLLPGVTEVSALELERPGKSYTSDTLRELKKRFPEDELWLLMGTDMFLTLPEWHESGQIMALAGIAAFARAEADKGEKLEAQGRYLRDTCGARVRIIQLPEIHEISSTQVRRRATGEGLWPPVWGYILRQGLYGVSSDLKGLSDADLRAVSYSMIRAKRIAHVQGTEEEAVRLARRWGADEEHARRAAILHDCTKYLELDEQLALCARYGVELDDMERGAVKLLHSKTGAALARYVFGEPEEVWQAICWHTTGKADMTLLEKILYIADYMEPTRDFEGVEKLRELAYADLDAAVLLGTEMSVEEMQQRGNPIHPNTLAARDCLLRASDKKLE